MKESLYYGSTGSLKSHSELGIVVHDCNSSTSEVEARESGAQGYPWKQSKFEIKQEGL